MTSSSKMALAFTALSVVLPTLAQAKLHPNTSAAHSQRIYFKRGATRASVRGHLSNSQHRFYVLKMRAGQHLRIEVVSLTKDSVPLLFVTPPRGKFDGDKTYTYSTNSSRAGDYKIEIAHNLMASNRDNGWFSVRVHAW